MNVSKRQRTGREGRWKSERGGVFSPLQHFFCRLFVSAVERVHKQSPREEGFEEKEKGDKKVCTSQACICAFFILFSFTPAEWSERGWW